MRLLNTYATKILLFWIIILCILYSTLSLLRHNHFDSGAFDLGIYDQAVWQYAHTIYPYNTIKERFILGDHLTLTLPLISPLFYLWDDVRILLIFQACFVSFSAIAIYKIATLRKFSPLTALCISIIYSIFYGIQYALYFDFHPIVLGVGLLAWLAYFFEAKKKTLFFIILILLLATQENMGLALAALGLIYIFHKQYRKQAILFFVGGIAISIVTAKAVGFFSSNGYQYVPHIDKNPLVLLQKYFDVHDKQLVWLYSFSSFSFLPLLSPGALLAVVFDLAQYFVLADFSHMWTPFLHHRAILSVLLTLGTLDALAFLQKRKIPIEILSCLLVVVSLFLQYIFHFPLNKLTKPAYWRYESWMNDNEKLFTLIPKDASIAATQNIVPHLSHRKEIYLVWPRKHGEDWWLDFVGKPEYLVVNTSSQQTLTQLLESPQNFQSAVTNMEKAGKITLEKQVGDAKLYRTHY